MSFCVNLLYQILLFYNVFLVAGIILSWLPMLYRFKIFRIIAKISDLYMGPFTGIITFGPIDFTPIIGFILYDGIVYAISYLL